MSEPVRNPDRLDPRTERIRRFIAACNENHLAVQLAPDAIDYLLGRIKTLEGERADHDKALLAANLANAECIRALDEQRGIIGRLTVERDRYRGESDDYRELWEQKCAEVERQQTENAALLASLETLRDQWERSAEGAMGSERAMSYGDALCACVDDLDAAIRWAR